MNDSKSSSCPIVLATPAQAFFHLGIREGEKAFQISFSVKAEENIRFYVIEGSQDLVSFEQLIRVFAKGNSLLPSSYSVAIHEMGYKFYRIRQIDAALAKNLSSPGLKDSTLSRNEVLGQGCTPAPNAPIPLLNEFPLTGFFL